MTILLADSIGKSFRNRKILSAATLRATAGQVRVIFGKNGIGKSTLIKIAAGITQADTGTVRFNGEYIERPSLPALARKGLFYLPDHDLLSRSTSLGAQLEYFARRFGRRSALDAATTARVEHLLGRFPKQLSGGELRRAELALALARRPSCLIADEPYRNVAPVDHDLLTTIFRGIAADGCAVVVTGHEVPSLLALADHITWCTAGTTYELGSPAEAKKHEGFRRDYIGTRQLL